MSAFEVNITPSRLKTNKRIEGREPTSVVMAPFSSKAIVTFEDVPVSKTAKRILKIFNPSSDEIEVHVTKFIRAEHNVTIDWTSNIIPAEEQIEMEMIWSPSIEIACKETLQLTDNRNFRKDVMVILKSISNKPISKNVKRFPTISSSSVSNHTKVLRLKSPTHSKPSAPSIQRRNRQSMNYKAQKTERMSPVAKKHPNSQKKQISPLLERNIPQINFDDIKSLPPPQTVVRPTVAFTPHKENVSPLTPGNVLDLIDKMQFTPATNTKTILENPSEIDYLSSLPTPIHRNAENVDDENYLTRQLRPRRLVAEHSEDEVSPLNLKMEARVPIKVKQEEHYENYLGVANAQTHLINNKTFDLKLIDRSDGLSDSQESIESQSERIVLNKTSTITPAISRPLSMIAEEDIHNVPNILQKTYEIKVDEQLKRDVKLVGTPLRKYSESMKDLSLKSPSSKMFIQGSMPNLNDMENIQSIEKNRYYHAPKATPTTNIYEQKYKLKPKVICLDDSDASNNSMMSLTSQADLLFNQNEILAQSSRFNLNEIGKKSRKNSPVSVSIPKSARKTTPTKAAKKLIESPVLAGTKRYRNLAHLDSPVNEISNLRIPKVFISSVSPPKRAKFESEPISRPSNNSKWPTVQPKKPKLSRTLSLVKKPITPRKIKEEPIVKLYDSDMYMQTYINPDPFAATTTRDPFLASTMYLDERAVEKHLIAFKKWLNALVTIPADLDTDCNQKIDVGRLFNEVRNKELILAPTKEEQSMNYLTKFRLENLRQEAIKFFMSEEMQVPCSKVAVYVHKKAISIRTDRNLHLDVVMQRYILELLLCFNPLWLRLGLEVVFAEKIHLHSCSDVVGLSTFIVNRLFKDKFLEQRYSKAYTLSDEYADHIKKFTLQKVLFLLLFLDKAKTKRIIKHNPCLFLKKSPYKEAREILLKFSCELLANIGDITRDLRRLGYVLTHKQNFLDEFNYAFSNIAVDLRDGIRLTRVMEIILLRDDMSELLRVPAISRLQRIYNVNLSLKALAEADFELKGDITAADIVDGHREKTLSLLWQIIYKFRSPKFHAAARVIQQWWRNSWLFVCIRRRIRIKIEKQRNLAATIIQSAYRGYMSRKYTQVFRWERTNAAICLQKYIRRHLAQKNFCHTIASIVHIQRVYRAIKYGMVIRQRFVDFRNRVTLIQRWFRRIMFARKLEQAAPIIRSAKAEALLRHKQAVVIQRYMKSFRLRQKFRGIVCEVVDHLKTSKLEYKSAAKIQSFFKMIKIRREFVKTRESAGRIQQAWRSYKQTKIIREKYLFQRKCAIHIQSQYRAYKLMQKERSEYLHLRTIVVKIQSRVRANKLCKIQRMEYLKLRRGVIVIQQRLRATLLMRKVRRDYHRQRSLIIKCQQRYRATLSMRKQRQEYLEIRIKVIRIQRFYRGWMQMKKDRAEFKKLLSVITIQRRLRATLLMRSVRKEYLRQRLAIIKCQQRFRAILAMRKQRAEYEQIKSKVICIQRFYRGWLQMKKDRVLYEKTRHAVVKIQQKLRATILARKVCAEYIRLTYYTMVIQRNYRGLRQMRIERSEYLKKRSCIIKVQRRFRANRQMKVTRQQFLLLKKSTILIQLKFKAYLAMRFDRAKFRGKKLAAICIQQRFREYLSTKMHRNQFLLKKKAAITIQRRFRAILLMRSEKLQYQNLRKNVVCIQRRWRARQEMKRIKAEYEKTRKLICAIQQRFRAKQLARKVRQDYERERAAIIAIQRRFRSKLLTRKVRKVYTERIEMIVRIQQRFRSYSVMKKQRDLYIKQKQSAVIIQTWFRSILQMRVQRNIYLHTKQSIATIQRYWRATLLARKQRAEFLNLRNSAIVIQRKLRATLAMRKQETAYQKQKQCAIVLQRRYRARLTMLKIRSQYLLVKSLIVCIQRKFRANKAMKLERSNFLQLKKATTFVQQKFRSKKQAVVLRNRLTQLKRVTLGLQSFGRGYLARRRYEELMTPEFRLQVLQRKAAVIIQRYWRGYRVRKRWQNVRIRTIRQNIKLLKESKNVLNTIKWKVQDSVRILRGRFSASDALNVLSRLERMSRTVPHLLMDHSDFISTFCYGIMAQAIRSEVDKQLIEYCSRVILNLARYNSTTANTFQEGGLVTIAQMLLRWCDKDCGIFNTLCTLIWVFSHCPIKRRKIREFMTTSEAIYVARETKKLVARKEKMKKNIRKPLMASTARGQQGIVFPDKALPSLEPDYGVIRNKPYVFISSVFAFDTILTKLNIDIYNF